MRYIKRNILCLFAVGISSGIPFLLTLSSLSFWIVECGATRTEVGLFTFVSLPYAFKFLWAWIVEQYPLPFFSKKLGLKKGWGVGAQIGMIICLIGLSTIDPMKNSSLAMAMATAVTFFAATQDIILDALRIEQLDKSQAIDGAAAASIGFRIGMLISGAGTLYMAYLFDWKHAYLITTSLCLIGVIGMLLFPTKNDVSRKKITFKKSILKPWQHVLKAPQLGMIILFVLTFKLSDSVLNTMLAPFLYDIGFDKLDYANITKLVGIFLMLLGTMLGVRFVHLMRDKTVLTLAIVASILCCGLFSGLYLLGKSYTTLFVVVGFENIISGMIATLFVYYTSKFCQAPFAGSQFSFLYSFGSLTRVVVSCIAGSIADNYGWITVFGLTATLMLVSLYAVFSLEKATHNHAMGI